MPSAMPSKAADTEIGHGCGHLKTSIWQFQPSEHQARMPCMLSLLSTEERDRCGRLYFEKDRITYAISHGFLRLILARELNCPPAEIAFAFEEKGKPYIEAPQSSRHIQFNLSHSGDWALIGVSDQARIGVDIEKQRPVQFFQKIIARVMAPAEQALMESLGDADRMIQFIRLWARKEALSKGLGLGFSMRFRLFSALNDRLELPAALCGCDSLAPSQTWNVADLEGPQNYSAALALEGGTPLIECRDVASLL